VSDEPESEDEDDGELSPERDEWYKELFRLKDHLILMALQEAEYYFRQKGNDEEEETVNRAVSDAFDEAAQRYTLHLIKGLSIK
jgi:hypothetical protein